jgi:hypothetical protein
MLALEQAQTIYSNFTEIQANEWAYQELADLNHRNNCAAKPINKKLVNSKPISRWEAAAILNHCIVSSSQIIDQIKQLLLEFEQELAISKARVDRESEEMHGFERSSGVCHASLGLISQHNLISQDFPESNGI